MSVSCALVLVALGVLIIMCTVTEAAVAALQDASFLPAVFWFCGP